MPVISFLKNTLFLLLLTIVFKSSFLEAQTTEPVKIGVVGLTHTTCIGFWEGRSVVILKLQEL